MRRATVLLATLVIGLAACGGGDDDEETPAGTPLRTINISETDFKLGPATVHVDRTGVYRFHVTNDGGTTHALEIEGEGVESETEKLSPGSSADLTVELTKQGRYEMYCPVDGHADQGMKGTLTVGAGGSGEAGSTPY